MNEIFTLKRGNFSEIKIAGEIAVHDGRNPLFHFPDKTQRFPARSLLKPFQFRATGTEIDSVNPQRTTAQVGSISATAEQVHCLETWYALPTLRPLVSQLLVTRSVPMDEENRVDTRRAGKKMEAIYHNCFSKHLAILSACQREGWDPTSYLSESHPFHSRLIGELSKHLGRKDFNWVTDGCGLPTPVLEMKEMARLFSVLGSEDYQEIGTLMMRYPSWVGGPGRQDTRLMEENPGRVIAKEGADGLLGISVIDGANSVGIVIKTWSGFQPLYAIAALKPLLESFGVKVSLPEWKGHEIEYHYSV